MRELIRNESEIAYTDAEIAEMISAELDIDLTAEASRVIRRKAGIPPRQIRRLRKEIQNEI